MKKRKAVIRGAATLAFMLCCVSGTTALAEGKWYKGDLHAHSLHSDGDSPVSDVIAKAESLGFDYFALTDHDGNMNGLPKHWSDPDYTSDKVTLLYGVEWTTDKGHANVWAAAPFDYSTLWEANTNGDLSKAVSAAHTQCALFSINHPTAYLCCPWKYPVPETIDSMEVWNSMYTIPNFNPLAIDQVWDNILMSGQRLPCVGGSDTHELKGIQSKLFSLGNPTTWVFANDKSAQSILDGIKAGHTSLSFSPDGPRVMFSADKNNDGIFETMNGDNMSGSGLSATFKISVADQNGTGEKGKIIALDKKAMEDLLTGAFWLNGSLKDLNISDLSNIRVIGVIKNGKLFKAWILTGQSPVVTFTDTLVDLNYYRVMFFGKPELDNPISQLLYGRLLGMTSPIYVGFHSDDAADDMKFYFGNLHSHCAVSDGKGTQKEAFTWARDVAKYNFYAITDHAEQTSPSEWKETGAQADAFNKPGSFVAMRGFEWSHALAGHINVYNTSSYTNSILTPSLDIFYYWLDKHNGLAQFNHPGREPLVFRNFAFNKSVADNIFAMETGNKGTGNSDGEYLAYYPKALTAGWNVAPTSNQDNHSLTTNSHRTAIITSELSRGAPLSAMKKRRLYSTDDPNINVVFKLKDTWMGSEVYSNNEPLLFTVDISDDEFIEKIELVNGSGHVVAVKTPATPTDKIQWNPMVPGKGIYYVKVTSENWYDDPDNHPIQIAVTAPITVK
ncbi:MAG: CehA/McbA family metallohydrolase [Desulfobacteraceae bacterium]